MGHSRSGINPGAARNWDFRYFREPRLVLPLYLTHSIHKNPAVDIFNNYPLAGFINTLKKNKNYSWLFKISFSKVIQLVFNVGTS
jgi:hypothetical protein